MSFLRSALSGEGKRGFTGIFFNLRFQEHDLFTRAGEFDFLACRGDNFYLVVRLEVHGDIFDIVFHGKYRDRNFDDVARCEQTGHERFVDFRVTGCRTVATVIFGNDHGTDFADILGHVE